MKKRKFTVGCKYALIITAAHNVGVKVGMLDDAERLIKEEVLPEDCTILNFEHCVRDAIDEVNRKNLKPAAEQDFKKLYDMYFN